MRIKGFRVHIVQGSSNVSVLHVPHQCLGLMGKSAEHEDHSPHQGPSDDGKCGDDDHHFIVFIALPVHIQPHQKPLKPNRFPNPFMSRSNPHSESLPDKPHPKLKHIARHLNPGPAMTSMSSPRPHTRAFVKAEKRRHWDAWAKLHATNEACMEQ